MGIENESLEFVSKQFRQKPSQIISDKRQDQDHYLSQAEVLLGAKS